MNYREVYDAAFANPTYSRHTTEEWRYQQAASLLDPDDHVVDIGAGRGVFARMVNAEVMDLDNYSGAPVFRFIDLSNPPIVPDRHRVKYDVAACLDVLEHLEFEHVPGALRFLRDVAPVQLIAVSNHPEVGIVEGYDLHPTKLDAPQWKKLIESAGLHVRLMTVFGNSTFFKTERV